MFTTCPHCQFLVAGDPRTGASPTDCPRCGKPLVTAGDAATASAPSLATLLNAAPSTVDREASASHAIEPETTPTSFGALTEAATADEQVDASAAQCDVAANADEAAGNDAAAPIDLSPPEPVAIDNIAVAAAAPLAARKAAGPRFLRRNRTTSVHARGARGQWAIVIALLLLLGLQVVIADRARLATQASWRPLVVSLCGLFRCDVPVWREPTAFAMLSRDVRPVPDTPGALQAQATFRNEARWAQGWPVILLTLKDADGRTLGTRALQPGDYLPEDEALTTIGPGQSAQMAVRIREPSASVVAFSFDFR